MGSRFALVAAMALALVASPLAARTADAPEVALPGSAYPASLNKKFTDPTIGIRG